jgi:hypothetical protein
MNFRRVWRTDQQAADRIKAGASSHPHLTLAWDEPEQRSQAAIALPRGHKSSHQRADQLTVALGVKQPRAPMADPTREWVRPAMPRLPSCVCIAATLHAIMPAPHSANRARACALPSAQLRLLALGLGERAFSPRNKITVRRLNADER